MTAMGEYAADEPEPPWLERWGAQVLSSKPTASGPATPSDGNKVHVLDPREQTILRRVQRRAVLRAALAGVASALASAIAEIVGGHHFRIDHAPTFRELAAFWGLYGAVTAIASVLEILYLYWDALRAVRDLAHGAGLSLGDSRAEANEVARALARAALELPDSHAPVLGVDPRRESSRAMLLVASLVYKAKIGLSSFLFKAVIRRALGRMATRQLLAFAAVPVNAAWNGIVAFLVLREARIRAMGASAVVELVPALIPDPAKLSTPARIAVTRAVGASIVRTQEAHPNLVVLLRTVVGTVGPFDDSVVLDDTRLFLAHLIELPREEQGVVLRILAIASLIDGRIAASERRLLREALVATSRVPDLAPVDRARRAFVRGRPFELADFAR